MSNGHDNRLFNDSKNRPFYYRHSGAMVIECGKYIQKMSFHQKSFDNFFLSEDRIFLTRFEFSIFVKIQFSATYNVLVPFGNDSFENNAFLDLTTTHRIWKFSTFDISTRQNANERFFDAETLR